MRRSQRFQFDYQSYRGRTTLTSWLKRVALVLAILVVLTVIFLFLVQPFISYTDEGIQWNLPFFSQDQERPSPDLDHITVVEEEPDTSQDEDEPPAEAPAPASALLSVPLSSLLDSSAGQLAQEAGADGVVADLKTDGGALGWQSQEELAFALQSEAETAGSDALAAWTSSGIYTVARLSCFRDEALGSNMDYTLRTSSSLRWRDLEGFHWTTPANPEVRSYLIGLMTELAQMGFDEIVLDHWGFPSQTEGALGNLLESEDNYPAGALDGVITEFLSQAAQALEPYGTRLSLRAPQDVFTGSDPSTGLTATALNTYVDRLWVSDPSEELPAALERAGVENTETRLVLLTDQPDPDSTFSQAVGLA